MKRILFIAKDDLYGPPTPKCIYFWHKEGDWKVDVLCLSSDSEYLKSLQKAGISFYTTKNRSGIIGKTIREAHFVLNCLKRTIFEKKYDAIYIRNPRSILGYLFSARKGAKLIYHTDEIIEPGHQQFYSFLERKLCRRADFVIAAEKNRAILMRSLYRLRDVPLVIENDCPLVDILTGKLCSYEPRASSSSSSIVRCLYQGIIGPDRLTTNLVKAFSLLPERFVLTLVGPVSPSSYLSVVQKTIAGKSLTDRVHIIESVPHYRLLQITRNHSIGILLYANSCINNYFCAPNKISEYASCGLPMVAPNYPGMIEKVRMNGIGVLCDPHSPRSIASAILEVERGLRDAYSPENIQQVFFDKLHYERSFRATYRHINRVFEQE